MEPAGNLYSEFHEILRQKFGERLNDYLFPPPVFDLMQGELLEMDLGKCSLKTKFPILEEYLNPFRAMQGGMIAAAVDNTLGPLSVAVAPPSVTRKLEMKYSQPARLDMGYIIVQARLVERVDQQLVFEARVSGPQGEKLATCKAVHWIISNPSG